MNKRNPKQEGSNLYDCRVQTGPCPNNCNQCFYNRPGAYYEDIEKRHYPPEHTLDVPGNGSIVRMNCGHDSNIERDIVIAEAQTYTNVFFNTSIPNFDFPGPVVFTANPKEEEAVQCVGRPDNLMFVRLRVSATNLKHIQRGVAWYTASYKYVPVVLTFMAYYEGKSPQAWFFPELGRFCVGYVEGMTFPCYEWKKRHLNDYWCPTPDFMRQVLKQMQAIGGRLVTMCGTPDSNLCKDCRNCETFYWQTKRYMEEQKCSL